MRASADLLTKTKAHNSEGTRRRITKGASEMGWGGVNQIE